MPTPFEALKSMIRLSDELKNSVKIAEQEAQETNQGVIGPEHYLSGVLTTTPELLIKIGVDPVQTRIFLGSPTIARMSDQMEPGLTPIAKDLLVLTVGIARARGSRFAENLDLLEAMLRSSNNYASKIMVNTGYSPVKFLETISERGF